MKIQLNLDEVLFEAPLESLEDFTDPDVLKSRFEEKLKDVKGKGVDRLGAEAFERQIDVQVEVIKRKVSGANYHFSPYLERLLPKGRGKPPRVVSVPTIRDRLVLLQLKDYLHRQLPEAVNRRLPNEYIRDIQAFCAGRDLQGLSHIRADIQLFFDKINHDGLLALLTSRLRDSRAVGLIRNAIRTPTIPSESHRGSRGRPLNRVGVPQGLAISNVLANAYLLNLDVVMAKAAALYLRYVDDILIFVETNRLEEVKSQLALELTKLDLSASVEKTSAGLFTDELEYLGYVLRLPTISIRRSSYERFLGAIAGLFARYQYRLRHNEFPPYLSIPLRQQVFIDELNEKITGAFSGTRRYGWLLYFIEINDEQLLHTLDGAIRRLFARLEDFKREAPPSLKRLARTYFQARFSPDSGYILNYNELNTVSSQLDFLISRGLINAADAGKMSAEEVVRRFEEYKRRQLQQLEMDVGLIS